MSFEAMMRAAAAERAQNVRARADRPSQRRGAQTLGTRAAMRARAQITLTRAKTKAEDALAPDDAPDDAIEEDAAPESSALLDFHGVASAYEAPYEMWDMFGPYNEVVSAGAGARSMARSDLDVPFVLGHDQLRRMARTLNGTLTLTETDEGLIVDAPALDPTDVDVAYIAPKLRAGLIDEMSFAFRIVRGMWSPDYTEYRIEEYDIHRGDVAIVGYGANPTTSGALRSQRNDNARARALLSLAIAR